ncbi:hypothetical protein A2Z22_04610 [Candidatus Woesebacteria bacterium RBG_16_34_12]|uniref:DUF642 domain-containing protein n=1 Tax=Candidatus Woesebacteria bacterium RBG_16_34_12 TaxID=1802480 RepID=A0A1F7XBN4_9BACT|nr:MAG: hypothetical protein A2Z22_04610 [Candidatus Woesebacteria bacterium RBG_16_34_12]
MGGWNVDWYGGSGSYGDQTRPEPAHLEYHRGVLGTPYEGSQYVELDSDWGGPADSGNGEPAAVTIYQDIPTVSGHNYKLRFAFAPRPNTAADTNRLEVKWDGVVIWDSGNQGDANAGIDWQYKEFDVTATSDSTELRFTDLGTADSLGSFIDNITLNEIVCEGIPTDPLCNLWNEKDLTEGDLFWNLNDVKPGDWGRNVISMHVYDNDYWACMLSDKQDLENVIIDPEAEAGDVTDPQGELSKYVDVFIWKDLNKNGVYEPVGETSVHQNGFPDVLALNEPPSLPLVASTTYYYGVAWCVGTQTVDHSTGVITCDGAGNHNDAQTDTLTIDMKFYVEQSRNNASFSCQSLVTPTPF